ncbi:hypothetical protein [Nocardioides daejeonensis]|nr:hypothetical protein [Nocardioides daejeonensis]
MRSEAAARTPRSSRLWISLNAVRRGRLMASPYGVAVALVH